MRKGAYLELTLRDPAGTPAADIQRLMETQLAGIHDGLSIQVLHTTLNPADPQVRRVVVYVEGDQPAPDDFQLLATGVIQRLWQSAGAQGPALAAGAPAAPRPALTSVAQWEDYDRMEGQAPAAGSALALTTPAALSSSCLAPVTGGSPVAGPPLPANQPRPTPVAGVFDQCPAGGDDANEAIQNTLKNRIDSAPSWQQTTVGAILGLYVPAGLPTEREEWSADQRAAIAQYEGLPVQIVGFLAGARVEGPESCNCHSTADRDFHLWVVDAQGTGREQSVVCEVTPRVRAGHPGWTIDRICSLVQTGTRVRISGWLMMDPAHPDEVGQTRGTTWEIHPILAIDVARSDGSFSPLDSI